MATLNEDENESLEAGLDIPVNVKNIFIDGLAKSKNELITNQLNHLLNVRTFGDLINQSNASKLKLERLGVFKKVEVFIDLADSAKPDDFDIYYYVRELQPVKLGAGSTCGTNEGTVSLNARLNNIRGVGEKLKAELSYGTKASAYSLSFVKPYLLDSDQKFSVNAETSTSDLLPSSFQEHRRGLGTSVHIPGPFGIHTLSWDYHWRRNTILPSAPFEIREQSGHSLKSALRHTITSDGRDDWIFPIKGHLFKHNIEYSGVGGNVRHLKTDVEVQLNKEIMPDFIVSGSLHAGGLRGLSDGPTLINDRYFLGGPLSVRGYAMRGIGQHAESASLGGELFWASGLHLYTPLPFRPGKGGFGELFRTHLFINAGNIANVGNLETRDFVLRPRLSFGLGLMVVLGGMARLEINYCIPKNFRPGDILNGGFQAGVGVDIL